MPPAIGRGIVVLGRSGTLADVETLKLTALSSCGGCAAKISQRLLAQVLRGIPMSKDPNLLVGAGTADDAGVYRISKTQALVQTVDFFTPIVDDAFDFGRIAATNALSDVYAMGGRPLCALNIVGMPTDKVPPEVITRVLLGGAKKTAEAGCALVGGHTIRNLEPIYGLAVTGMVSPKRMLTNAAARVGDLLVLTKPIGTGIVTTGIKRNLTSARLAKKVVSLMTHLNKVGADLAEMGICRAATDLTGFGLLGHLMSMCRASGVQARVDAVAVPPMDGEVLELIARGCVSGGTFENMKSVEEVVDWGKATEAQRTLLADAQTSGGLLLCVSPKKLGAAREVARRNKTMIFKVIGEIERAGKARIRIDA